jgi:tetratricopeptide (TPR) repeat protein
MRRFASIFNAFLLLLFTIPAVSQVSDTAGEQGPDALTTLYKQAMQAKEWPRAIAAAQQLVAIGATSQSLLLLGNAQLYSGTADVALATYEQALAAAQKERPTEGQLTSSWNDGLAQIHIGKGNALLKLKRTDEAVEAYNHAAGLASNSALAYFNICAVLYNNGNTYDSATACRKCVQADPSKANAWFILGSDLFADAPINNGKVAASFEAREALEKYLALAPDGPHAADVKAMLEMIAK